MNDTMAPCAQLLEDSGELIEALRLGEVGLWRWRVDTDRLFWTSNMEAVHALPPNSFDGTLSSFQTDIHPDDRQAVWLKISEAVANDAPYRIIYRAVNKHGGEPRWLEASGGLTRDSEGNRWLTGACMDVTERIKADLELQRRLKQQQAVAAFGSFALGEARFQAVADRAAQVAAEVLDAPLIKILQFADNAEQLYLRAGLGWREGIVGHALIGLDSGSQAAFTLSAGEPVIVEDLATETRFSGPSLLSEHEVVSGLSVIIAGDQNRPFGVFGVYDTRRRKFDRADAGFLTALANVVAASARQIAATEHRQLLVREMAHRAGNMLQLVNTLAHQTFHDGNTIAAARHTFSERLGSLSRANYLIAKGGWSATRFRVLAEETLEPFRDRIRFSGRDVLLPPELCFDLGLVLHELSTNSAKYGSLSHADGTIRLDWQVRGSPDGETQSFFLEWTDPEPAALPTSQAGGTGFGSKLMRLLIEKKWNGTIEPPTPSGYRFAFTIPLATSMRGEESAA